MKIRPVGAELFHADGRTVMTKLTVAFRNFSNAPKNRWGCSSSFVQRQNGSCVSEWMYHLISTLYQRRQILISVRGSAILDRYIPTFSSVSPIKVVLKQATTPPFYILCNPWFVVALQSNVVVKRGLLNNPRIKHYKRYITKLCMIEKLWACSRHWEYAIRSVELEKLPEHSYLQMLGLTKKFKFNNSQTKIIGVRNRKPLSNNTNKKCYSKPRNTCCGARYDISVQTSWIMKQRGYRLFYNAKRQSACKGASEHKRWMRTATRKHTGRPAHRPLWNAVDEHRQENGPGQVRENLGRKAGAGKTANRPVTSNTANQGPGKRLIDQWEVMQRSRGRENG
jgi:hypothetical protein